MFKRDSDGQPLDKQYFDHIDAKRIQMVIEQFEKNPADKETQKVNLGKYSVEFKSSKVFLTLDPTNEDETFEFSEDTSQKRQFRCDTSKFASNIATASLKHGNNGQRNKIGEDWFASNYKVNPTLNQIIEGL